MTIRWLSTEATIARTHEAAARAARHPRDAQYWLGYAHACEMAITKARSRRKRSTRQRAR